MTLSLRDLVLTICPADDPEIRALVDNLSEMVKASGAEVFQSHPFAVLGVAAIAVHATRTSRQALTELAELRARVAELEGKR